MQQDSKTKDQLGEMASSGDEATFNQNAYHTARSKMLEMFGRDLPRPLISPGQPPVDDCDTCFAVGSASQAVWECLASFSPNKSHIDVNPGHALLSLRQERYMEIDGSKPSLWDEFSGVYECGDGSLVQLHCNFPNHRDAAIKALGGPASAGEAKQRCREIFARGEDLERRVLELGGAAAMVKPLQHRSQTKLGDLVEIIEIASDSNINKEMRMQSLDSQKNGIDVKDGEHNNTNSRLSPGSPNQEPTVKGFANVTRVVDISRVLAGPVATQIIKQVLGSHAEVLSVSSPNLPQVAPARLLTSLGKRSAHCDFNDASQLERFKRDILGHADILVQSYRHSSLDKFGLSDADMSKDGPKVRVNIRAYDSDRHRRGYDSLVQCHSGMFDAHSAFVHKKEHLPVQALDHLTGMLAALGALVALRRHSLNPSRSRFVVNLSLERTARFLIDEMPMRAVRVPGGLERIEKRIMGSVMNEKTVKGSGMSVRYVKNVLGGDDEMEFVEKDGEHDLKWMSVL